MAHYKLLVWTEPTPGQEDEYNRWYNDVHLADVVQVPGFVSAQRFRLQTAVSGEMPHRYLAIYEIDCDDPQQVLADLFAAAEAAGMSISGALNSETPVLGLFEPCSPVVMAPARS